MKFFIMRHGEVLNPNKVLYGRLPGFHLSKEGEKDVAQNAKKLKDQDIEVIFSSPMERTIETAKIVANVIGYPKEKILIDKRILEVEIKKEWLGKANENFHELKKQGDIVESKEKIEQRMWDFFQERVGDNKNFLMVSHGDPIMALVGLLAGKFGANEKQDYIETGQIISCEYHDNKVSIK